MRNQITFVGNVFIFTCAWSISCAWFSSQDDSNWEPDDTYDVIDNGMAQFKHTQALSDAMTSTLEGFLLGNIEEIKDHMLQQVSCTDQSTASVLFRKACLRLISNYAKQSEVTRGLGDVVLNKMCGLSNIHSCHNSTHRIHRDTDYNSATNSRAPKHAISSDSHRDALIKFTTRSILVLSSRYSSAFCRDPVIISVLFDPTSYNQIYRVYFGVVHILVRGVSLALSIDIGPSLQDHQIAGNQIASKLWLLSGVYIPTICSP